MRNLKPKPINGYIIKECAFCSAPFYTSSDRAKYCSASHKVQYSQLVKKSHQWYSHNPNEGKVLPPGTVTSWEMPESTLVLSGNMMQILSELSKHLSTEQLIVEKENIENRKPFSVTKEWIESVVQIFTDTNFIEVLGISPGVYKLYIEPWGDNNENPVK